MCLQTEVMLRYMKATEASSLSCFEVGHKTATDLKYGLTSVEVADRHRVHGYNEFHITQEEPLWKKYIAQVSTATHLLMVGLFNYEYVAQLYATG